MNGEFSPRVLPLCIVMMITSFSPSTCHPSSAPPPPAPGVSGSRPGRSRSRLPGCRPRSHSQTASFKCREIQRGYNEDTTRIQWEYNEDTAATCIPSADCPPPRGTPPWESPSWRRPTPPRSESPPAWCSLPSGGILVKFYDLNVTVTTNTSSPSCDNIGSVK